jgi:hypothetical protein
MLKEQEEGLPTAEICRSGECVGWSAECLESTENTNEPNAGCWKRRLAVLVIVMSWATGCAVAGFETGTYFTPRTLCVFLSNGSAGWIARTAAS